MAKLLKLRRGTTSQHSSFTGAEGEVTVDTDKDSLVVHNGSTAGGFPIARSPATAGTVGASEVVQVDANKDASGFRNITATGELDAATLDISGNADIDGTLEADAITVDGTALNEYISDTVGAMVGSNTETGITVTYLDDDNTLDFVVGTLNQDTTGTAAIATTVTVADESSDTSCNVLYTTAATGNLAPKSGTNLTFNSNTGELTTSILQTTGNLTVGGNLTVNGTTTTVATTNTTVSDSLIELGTGTSGTPANDAGLVIERGSSNNAFIGWDESSDRFLMGTGTFTGSSTGDLSVTKGTLNADIAGDTTGIHNGPVDTADNEKLLIGTGDDTHIYHNGSHTYISHRGTGSLILEPKEGETGLSLDTDGAVKAYFDNTKRFETTGTGCTVTGDLNLGDSNIIEVGASNDLQIWHNATDSFIKNSTGILKIMGSDVRITNAAGDENGLYFDDNGQCSLYYDGSKKLETVTGGVTVTGTCTATAFAGDGSALTGIVSFVSGMILIWSGSTGNIPSGWVLCNGSNSTPDLRDRFVVGAGNSYSVGATGGATTDTVSISDSDSVSISVSISGSGTTGYDQNFSFGSQMGGGARRHNHAFSFSGSGSGSDTVNISGSDTVNTVPPYYALCYIMKT